MYNQAAIRQEEKTSEHHLKLSDRRRRSIFLVGQGRLIEDILILLRLRSGGRTCQKEGKTMLTYCQK